MLAETALSSRIADRRRPGDRLDVVCIAVSNWGVVRSNPDYTIEELARRGHRVLVIEPFETLSSSFRMAAMQNRAVETRFGLRRESDSLWIYRPPPVAAPGQSRTPWAGRVSGRILARLIRGVARDIGLEVDVIWSFMYNSGSCLALFPDALKIYENGDEDIALARSPRQRRTVRTLDRETCRAADLVFAVTEELCVPRRAFNSRTFEINCGVDPDLFRAALDPSTPLPPQLAALKGPVIGYFGGLDPWKIDVELVIRLARLRPNWSIVFVGYVWFGFDDSVFRDLPNVHILGPQPYDHIPRFLAGFDIGLMPFPINEITRNGDALKCYEYLAAGVPVVSRDVPVARRLPDLVRVADTPEEFVVAIEAALADKSQTRATRSEAMKAHSWSSRVDRKMALIEETLSR